MENGAENSATLRNRAEQARRHAMGLWPHAAAEQLLAYARELEAEAAALEQPGEGNPVVSVA